MSLAQCDAKVCCPPSTAAEAIQLTETGNGSKPKPFQINEL